MGMRVRRVVAAGMVVVGTGLLIYSGLGFVVTSTGHFIGWGTVDRLWMTNGVVLILIGCYVRPGRAT